MKNPNSEVFLSEIKQKTNWSVSSINQYNRILLDIEPDVRILRRSIGVLRNTTLELLLPFLRVVGAKNDVFWQFYLSGYGDAVPLTLDHGSDLYARQPDYIWVALELAPLSPKLYYSFATLSKEDIELEIQQVSNQLETIVKAVRQHSNAQIMLQNFRPLFESDLGLYDSYADPGLSEVIYVLNHRMRELTQLYTGVYVFDYYRVVSRVGASHWVDRKLWLLANTPIAPSHYLYFANEWAAFMNCLLGRRKKCIVLDMDNTLWGSILGEDGIEGIKIGGTYPGNAFREFQFRLLNLYHQGIMLAACSKNNEEDVLEVWENHPDMVLRKKHFAAWRINWQNKAQNIREIAQELNIGLDSMVLFDDNPAERELVRQQLPEVMTPEMPEDPMDFAPFLTGLRVFDTLSLTQEDKERSMQYISQRQRNGLKNQCKSIKEYYQSLEMQLEIQRANTYNIPRIAQLTQRTNQFNLTAHRYSEGDVRRFAENTNDYLVYCVRVIDKFGDNGITGAAIVRHAERNAEIDTFLLSCRVIGRTVETAFLYYMLNELYDLGINTVHGKYTKTSKNQVVKTFYSEHGFDTEAQEGTEVSYVIHLTGYLPIPAWFEIRASHLKTE